MSANPDGLSAPDKGSSWPRLVPFWAVLALVVERALPACLAAAHAANVPDAAHDEAMVRALGLGWTGAWRALDAPWCGLFAWLPVGTKALRAALASAAACGAGGGALFVLARALLGAPGGATRAADVVAGIVALAAAMSPPWQCEAASPAGGRSARCSRSCR